jgi:hypothetical protein
MFVPRFLARTYRYNVQMLPIQRNIVQCRDVQIRGTKFCTVAPNICGVSALNSLLINFLDAKILKLPLNF